MFRKERTSPHFSGGSAGGGSKEGRQSGANCQGERGGDGRPAWPATVVARSSARRPARRGGRGDATTMGRPVVGWVKRISSAWSAWRENGGPFARRTP